MTHNRFRIVWWILFTTVVSFEAWLLRFYSAQPFDHAPNWSAHPWSFGTSALLPVALLVLLFPLAGKYDAGGLGAVSSEVRASFASYMKKLGSVARQPAWVWVILALALISWGLVIEFLIFVSSRL